MAAKPTSDGAARHPRRGVLPRPGLLFACDFSQLKSQHTVTVDAHDCGQLGNRPRLCDREVGVTVTDDNAFLVDVSESAARPQQCNAWLQIFTQSNFL
eukprot:2851396-Amphidinium_carterae.1